MKIKRKYLKYIDKHFKNIKQGSTVAISGATGSTGKALAYYLAYLNCNLVFLVRNIKEGNNLKKELLDLFKVNIDVIHLDYANKKSVDQTIFSLSKMGIDVFFNNAGIYHQPLKLIDNYDITFYVNFLMPVYLEEKLAKICSNIKIINTGSISYRYLKLNKNDLLKLNEKNRTLRYGNSKRLLMLYTTYKKYLGNNFSLAHPGISTTNLFASKNKAYPKIFYIFITPLMKIIFMNPNKAALSLLKGINEDNLPFNKWIGPRGLFHAWGYPNIQAIKEGLLEELKNKELLDRVFKIINKEQSK